MLPLLKYCNRSNIVLVLSLLTRECSWIRSGDQNNGFGPEIQPGDEELGSEDMTLLRDNGTSKDQWFVWTLYYHCCSAHPCCVLSAHTDLTSCRSFPDEGFGYGQEVLLGQVLKDSPQRTVGDDNFGYVDYLALLVISRFF